MIFLFCSVYSTCRCPFFFAKLLPGRMVKYRHANRQRTERQLSANQRFGYFINSSVCFLALSPLEKPNKFDPFGQKESAHLIYHTIAPLKVLVMGVNFILPF